MERISTGIPGLDDMLSGGIPKNQTFAVIGAFGTGKSTIALQYTYEGLVHGEKCVYISLDEDEEGLLGTADAFGWDLRPYLENQQLVLIRLSATDIKTSITRVESELPDMIKSLNANRLAFDSITLFEMLFETDVERRNKIFKLCNLLKKSGATALLTSEVDILNPFASKFGLVEYAVDGVISLRYLRPDALRPDALRAVTLALEIIKMRRTAHSRVIKPYELGPDGVEVHSDSELF